MELLYFKAFEIALGKMSLGQGKRQSTNKGRYYQQYMDLHKFTLGCAKAAKHVAQLRLRFNGNCRNNINLYGRLGSTTGAKSENTSWASARNTNEAKNYNI